MTAYDDFLKKMDAKARNKGQLLLANGSVRIYREPDALRVVDRGTTIGHHYPDGTATLKGHRWMTVSTQRHRAEARLPVGHSITAPNGLSTFAARVVLPNDRTIYIPPAAADHFDLRIGQGGRVTAEEWARFRACLMNHKTAPEYTFTYSTPNPERYRERVAAAKQTLERAKLYLRLNPDDAQEPDWYMRNHGPTDGHMDDDLAAEWARIPPSAIRAIIRRHARDEHTCLAVERNPDRGWSARYLPVEI